MCFFLWKIWERKLKSSTFSYVSGRLAGCWWLRLAIFGDDAHFQNNVAVKGRLPAEKPKTKNWNFKRDDVTRNYPHTQTKTQNLKKLTPFGRWRKLCELDRRNQTSPSFAWIQKKGKNITLRFLSVSIPFNKIKLTEECHVAQPLWANVYTEARRVGPLGLCNDLYPSHPSRWPN